MDRYPWGEEAVAAGERDYPVLLGALKRPLLRSCPGLQSLMAVPSYCREMCTQ